MKRTQSRRQFSTLACLLATGLAGATAGSTRLRLVKIAAQVTVSVRRIHVRICRAFPMADVFDRAHAALTASGLAATPRMHAKVVRHQGRMAVLCTRCE